MTRQQSEIQGARPSILRRGRAARRLLAGCAVAFAGAVGLASGIAYSQEASVPPQPSDPVAAKAYGVFARACAGCHQQGRLKAPRPSGYLANILDLDSLALNSALVVPGNPDASPLYSSMQSRAMPPDTLGEDGLPEIVSTDLLTIRDWIEQLPVDACSPPDRLAAARVAQAITTHVTSLPPDLATKIRFVSLAPLRNACASPDEMESARQAVALLINSLSLALEPYKPVAIDPDGAILAIDLGAVGWTAATWDRLAQRAPASPFTVFDDGVKKSLGTDLPVVNADWFADVASRAPLYYELLGLPESLPALLANLRLDLTDLRRGSAERIGLRASHVARGNRLFERRSIPNGAAWFSTEFAPTAGRPDMFDLIVAAAGGGNASEATRSLLQGDATLLHFDLPNGFPAYFVANPSGARVNDVPLSVLKDDNHPGARVSVAQSCMSCHASAPVAVARGQIDDLKARLSSDATLSKEARDRLLALHPEAPEWQRRLDDDQKRYLRATAAAGIDPLRRSAGLEILPALVARYRRDVTAAELADLVDVDVKTLFDLGRSGGATLADVIERIKYAPVPRGEVDAVVPEIAARRGLKSAAAGSLVVPPVAAQSPDATPSLMRLVLKPERSTYQAGDLLTLTARTNANCYLTVLTVDGRGRATVLFPNEFEPNNFIEAGRELRVPGDKAPYQFRLRDKGHETLVGTCATASKAVDGIKHDFEMQRFTELGDYRAFINRNWMRDSGDSKPKAKVARRAGDQPSVPEAAKPDIQSRTAARITIE